MEMTCPDCGMCESHGTLNEMKKGQKDSNGVTKCWSGYHAQGTKKGKNGGRVRNCVPNEGVEENFEEGWKDKAAGAALAGALAFGSNAHAGDDNSNARWTIYQISLPMLLWL
jgi:hypothetical protein